jgi:peptide/nickel transport system substrate-binding protein
LIEGGVLVGKASDRILLEAYDNYWDPRYPKVERVVFDNTLIGDRKEAMRLCREEEGAVDIVSYIRPLDTLKVAESPFSKVVKSRDVTILGGPFNQRKKDSKWKDIRLRQALNYAVNRRELWKSASKANAYNLEGFPIPAGGYGHNPNLVPWKYDTDRVRSLLAAAGYPEGFEVKMITHEAFKLETRIIRRMLERIGLKVKLDILTFTEWVRKTYIPILDKSPEEQDWDISLNIIWDWAGHTAASILTIGFIEDSCFRWIEYDPVYEEMWKDMTRTVDYEAQGEKIQQMVRYLYDHAHALFIYSPITLYAVNKGVNFVPQARQNLLLKETSVTDNHWSVQGEKK